VINKGKEYVSELAREYEKADEAGIDIVKAQMVLREEDKYDKELFKQKVKRKHREEKRKLRQNKRKDDEESNQSASSNDSESDVEDADLSWLPNLEKRSRSDDDLDSEGEGEEREMESESEESIIQEMSKGSQRTMEWKM